MEKIWLKCYQEGVPATINADEYASLVEMFQQSCEKFSDRPAFSNYGNQLTYAELYAKAEAVAAFFQQQLQLKKGDRLGIMMPNLLQYPVVMYGALIAGLVVVNINPQYTADELVFQVNDAQLQTLVVMSNYLKAVEGALDRSNLKNIIVTDLGDLFSFPKAAITNWWLKYVKRLVPKTSIPKKALITFKDMLAIGQKLKLEPVAQQGDDLVFLQYTGGTTGTAKGAMLTNRNLVANLLQLEAFIHTATSDKQEVVVTAIPLYHIFSLTANCLLFTKLGAMNLLITDPRNLDSLVEQLRGVPFTFITGVNTLFNALLHHPLFKVLVFNHIKMSIGGGMAVHHTVAKEWQQVTGSKLLEGYGLTEASPVVALNPINSPGYSGSIGLPLPSTDVVVCDDDGQECAIGQPGELCVKGPQVMRGYWQLADETKQVLSADGWLHTGDLVTMDEQGYLHIVDRKKDMIIVSGFKVFPKEVETVLAAHPGILEAGVVGTKKDIGNEEVCAFIVKKETALTEKEVIDYCREHLTPYKIPRSITFLEELPKSSVGKILRRELLNIA